MAQWISAINFGNGSNGSPNAISGTINYYNTITGTSGQTSATIGAGWSWDAPVLIHQSQGTGVGQWELNWGTISSGTTITFRYPLAYSYTTGAQIVTINQYTGGTISGAVSGQDWNGTTGGIVALMSNGDLTVSGSLNIVGGNSGGPGDGQPATGWYYPSDAGGFRGGGTIDATNTTGFQGEGTSGASSQSSSANGNGGGAGGGNANYNAGGGGGNGAAGSAATGSGATNGAGGDTSGNAGLTNMTFGGGGGGASGIAGSDIVTGSNGGGIILIISKNFTLSGTLNVNGGNVTYNARINGGTGAGGSVLIKTQVAALGTNKITASAGTTAQFESPIGGLGGVGRIRCDYLTSVSGSTTPALSSAQDTSLIIPSSNFFAFF